MIYFRDDRFFKSLIENESSVPVEYGKTGVVNYNSLYLANQAGDETPLFYNDELKRYINIRYEHLSVNWTLGEGEENFD